MSITESELQSRADRLVQQEVQLCLSGLVSLTAELANMVLVRRDQPATELAQQAQELCYPVLDYEEAATQAGWKQSSSSPTHFNIGNAGEPMETRSYHDWAALCADQDIDPYEWEVFEHWAVSQWLAEKLLEQGERVDTDFAGLNVWARTTTGQAISMDSVIRTITLAMLEA